jgi:hypothetical protein
MPALPGWTALISLALSVAIFLMIVWINFGRPWRRSRRMRRPFDLFFQAEPRGGGVLSTTLAVPAHSVVQIDFRLVPRLHHVRHEVVLTFGGDPEQKPLPRSAVNTFIKEGAARVQDPKTNANHYIDYDNGYHIKNRVEHTRGNTYALGFSVETRGPGHYPVELLVMTEDGEGRARNDLTLVVA